MYPRVLREEMSKPGLKQFAIHSLHLRKKSDSVTKFKMIPEHFKMKEKIAMLTVKGAGRVGSTRGTG